MKTLIALILWCMLLVMCWPLALFLLVFLPLVWLVLLPFTIVGLTIGAASSCHLYHVGTSFSPFRELS